MEEKNKLNRAIGRFTHHHAGAAFDAWWEYAGRRADLKRRLKIGLAVLLTRELRSAFNSWLEFTQNMNERRETVSSYSYSHGVALCALSAATVCGNQRLSNVHPS